MEVIVTDDGAPEVSLPVVADFAHRVDFPVRFTTHAHEGFQLARCRNEGIAVSTAPYLLMTDGDCILPPDHVKWHLKYRRTGRAVVGDCYRLDLPTSERIDESTICDGRYLAWVSARERRRMAAKTFRAWCYRQFRCSMRPRMTGNNIGIWRTDIEQVNGFDENYIGWGLEDRDLQLRLSRLGLKFQSILRHTLGYHLWHPPVPSFARNNVETENLEYFKRTKIPTHCRLGLAERIPNTQAIQFTPAVSIDSEINDANEDAIDILPFPTQTTISSRQKAA
jgi:glycosyltransferase involved in cell wall biosynthesis